MTTIRDFVPLTKLGEGTYSIVYKVRRLTDNHIYALKKVKMNQLSKKEKENALNQIRILASIDSSAIIPYKEAFFDEKLNVLCIVMEYADGGDLHTIISSSKQHKQYIPESNIWKAAFQILSGLAQLHSKGILHRDLKCANIFTSNKNYKIGDLNVSKVNGGKLAYTQTGTPYYASPEVWRDEPYDSKSDIWSFGCIIYQMATLKPPFHGKDMEELFRNVQKSSLASISKSYSKQLWELINLCLQKEPSQRSSAQSLLENKSFEKYFKTDLGEPSILFDSVVKQQKLLQTIKLPFDLKHLKKNLPESKYNNFSDKLKQNKSFVTQCAQNVGELITHLENRKIPAHVNQSAHKYDRNGKQLANSQLFKNPLEKSPSHSKLDKYLSKIRSPVSEMKLSNSRNEENQQSQEYLARYASDRKNLSEKKSNKVERPLKLLEKYESCNDLIKKPITSMPRTQKMPTAKINNSCLIRDSERQLQELRKKLAKKSRVLSSNQPKPSWWN